MLDEIRDMAQLMYLDDEAGRDRFLADIDASLEENSDDMQEQAMILQVRHATGCDTRGTLRSKPGRREPCIASEPCLCIGAASRG